jgi:hypothetical protein
MLLATTFYHIAQRSVPTYVNPVSSLVLNYITALIGTQVVMILFPMRATEPLAVKI